MQPGDSAGQQAQRRLSKAEGLRAQAQELNERAARVERTAEMWGRGHVGEQTVGSLLEQLRPLGFEVLHDARWPGRKFANIDHVAIGPPGILVVDAKNWSGNVTIRDGVLRQNGYRRDKEISGARDAGRAVADTLHLPWALHVIPVIALAATDADGVHRCKEVTVVGQRDFLAWAASLAPQLNPADVRGVATHLRHALPPASMPDLRPAVSAAVRPRREPSARQRRPPARRRATRRGPSGKETLVKLAVVTLMFLLAPALLRLWMANAPGLIGAVMRSPTRAVSTPAPVVATPVFANCAGLNTVYPYGVQRTAATDIGTRTVAVPVVDNAVAVANMRLDRDHDGLVCEVSRAVSRPRQ